MPNSGVGSPVRERVRTLRNPLDATQPEIIAEAWRHRNVDTARAGSIRIHLARSESAIMQQTSCPTDHRRTIRNRRLSRSADWSWADYRGSQYVENTSVLDKNHHHHHHHHHYKHFNMA